MSLILGSQRFTTLSSTDRIPIPAAQMRSEHVVLYGPNVILTVVKAL